MNINSLCGFLDSLDRRLSVAGDYCALIGSIILVGLIVSGVGYTFWYVVANMIYTADFRVQCIILVLIMSILEGFRPALRWFRNRLKQKPGAA